ncbi:hypothetical protein [uncultured Fibrobacter sp.]|uniref:hypothetical protein n=1 Tax=uncultured Fibrobacter sp. TaxID=261512 RepID=UPI0025F67FD6|nr:hypothetical protein [uncultured Fibrobacter sp.]
MNMKMKRTLFTLLAASVAALANPVNANKDLLESKADTANAKRGFEIGGAIRAVAQRSSFDTKQNQADAIKMPTEERNEFVTADINFGFRPYEEVRANVMLRLGGGMQEYFASAAKTLTVAWINVEGNVGNSFYWIVGDFRQQYSPLTLFLPGIDIMYEPTVFARKRHMAQKEQMLEGNQRNLQGANLQFRANLGEAAGEFRAEALFARVNRTSVLDFSGAEGNIMPNGFFAGATQASNMDKWLAAGNLELLPLNKNLYIGATPMYIFDNKNTYAHNVYRHGTDEDLEYDLGSPYERGDVNPFDTAAQNTFVVSGRLGADVAGLIGSKTLVADFVGEGAMSMDKVDKIKSIDLATGAINTAEETENGKAILVTANLGYKVQNSFGVVLAVDFIRNDSNWYNNLAQSSNFFAQRILNSDVDTNQVRFGVNAPLYSTFDALYNFSPKFAPVAVTLGTDDKKTAGGQTESYNIAPYNKNSWTTNVYTHAQLALLEKFADPNIQLSLPNGLATANRMGGRTVLTTNWKDLAELQGMFSTFNQVKALSGFKEANYMEYGGGAKWDIFKTAGFQRPLEISGSYKHSQRSVDYDPAIIGTAGTAEFKSDFINAGLYLQYLPRLGFTAGFQMINSEINDQQAKLDANLSFPNVDRKKTPILKGTQKQWMVGLDYAMEEHAWLAVNVGQIMVSNKYSLALGGAALGTYKVGEDGNYSYTESKDKSMNMPAYYYVEADANPATFTHEFTQMIFEASINVEF